jgi:SSS family transporter
VHPLDYLVIALYAALMLAIGRYYGNRVHGSDDYLLGGRTMHPAMVGLSLFATLYSTLSYLAVPGEVIKNGPMYFAQYAAAPFIVLLVGWLLIPRIMQQKDVTSGYELLEKRLGVTGRLLGAGMFLTLRTLWMSAILYATTSKVLVPLLGLDPRWTPLISVVMGGLTVVYVSEGGMRAVVMTDALQAIIMMCGAIAVIVVVTRSLGGVAAWWPQGWVEHWQRPVFWFHPTERITFMGASLSFIVWMTCTAGSDQMAIQRYLSTRDVRAARRSFAVSMISDVVVSTLLLLVGLAVLGFYTRRPDLVAPGRSLLEQSDELLPRFVVDFLPTGVSGFVIAAMLSAAMSSLSSGINSASAVVMSDFVDRFAATPPSQEANVRIARTTSVAIGALAVVLSIFVDWMVVAYDANLLDVCYKVVNLLTAPLFTLFFLAMFVPWSKPRGAVAAAIASVWVGIGIVYFRWGGMDFLWMSPLSLLAGIAAGMVASLPAGLQPDAEPLEPPVAAETGSVN